VSKLSDVESVENVEAGDATRNGYYKYEGKPWLMCSAYRESNPWGAANLSSYLRSKFVGPIHSGKSIILGSLNEIIESKKSAEWWNVINDKKREWTDGPKYQES
jgi:hypothetical protein